MQMRRLLSALSSARLRESTRKVVDLLQESESDKGRVVNSAALRRLQQKAQVFPLDGNAAVRTRLTHSLEVAQVGRYLAQKVIESLGAGFEYRQLTAFVTLVENACLLHDIGNPPFGHLGESAVQEWFRGNKSAPDLEHFDGNPQGFRQISFLGGRDAYGLNLTCSLLLSTIKYPWSIATRPDQKLKVGIYSQDWKTYLRACELAGWDPGKKFPFLRLMEAADDISYCMSDLEDALEKDIVTWRDLADDLGKVIGKEWFPEDSGAIEPIVRFKTTAINRSVDEAARKFVENLDGILEGAELDILPSGGMGGVLSGIKAFARRRIYTADAAERVELAGRSALKGLLEHFKPLLDLTESEFLGLVTGDRDTSKKFPFEARLLRRLPKRYLQHYKMDWRGQESVRRAHLVVDFVSGMTDAYALETYQVLEGIRL